MSQKVSTVIKNCIAVVIIDNPPVNSLGAEVRAQLLKAIEVADNDPKISAIVIKGSGNTFPVGADIKEFNLSPQAPHLPHICERIENCFKPVIVALHGTALGGGLEIALAGHYRVAILDTKIGLPEVNLGLLPGAGGTQRLPRLSGIDAALNIISSGRLINLVEALELGIIDALVDDLEKGLNEFVTNLITSNFSVRRTRDMSEKILDNKENRAFIYDARNNLSEDKRTLLANYKIIDCIEATLNLDFDEGLKLEIEKFAELRVTAQSKGLIHAFFAERVSAKVPVADCTKPRIIKKIGVVGGGTMGTGISIALMKAGLKVTMIEKSEANLSKGHTYVHKAFERDVFKGRLSKEKKDEVMDLYSASTDYNALNDVDMVIEAVFEEIEVKKSVFKILDKVVPRTAILASNTSYLDLDEIAKVTQRPQDVIGLHFFSPANLMRLLEIVVPNTVSDDVVATGFALAKKIGKVPVRAGNCDGFIGNRILSVYLDAAAFMIEDGASPYEIDAAVRSFGYSIGPYQMIDFVGGDIGWVTRKRQSLTRASNLRCVEIADRLCERGWFGQKTRRGFYKYDGTDRQGTEDPEVLDIINRERELKRINVRRFSKEEIIRRYLAAMVNEGANVLQEGIALRPSDIDVIKLFGYGFPRYRGGPMKYADTYGLQNVLADLLEFAQEDPIFWKPSPLILDLVKNGRNFDCLNN